MLVSYVSIGSAPCAQVVVLNADILGSVPGLGSLMEEWFKLRIFQKRPPTPMKRRVCDRNPSAPREPGTNNKSPNSRSNFSNNVQNANIQVLDTTLDFLTSPQTHTTISVCLHKCYAYVYVFFFSFGAWIILSLFCLFSHYQTDDKSQIRELEDHIRELEETIVKKDKEIKKLRRANFLLQGNNFLCLTYFLDCDSGLSDAVYKGVKSSNPGCASVIWLFFQPPVTKVAGFKYVFMVR